MKAKKFLAMLMVGAALLGLGQQLSAVIGVAHLGDIPFDGLGKGFRLFFRFLRRCGLIRRTGRVLRGICLAVGGRSGIFRPAGRLAEGELKAEPFGRSYDVFL